MQLDTQRLKITADTGAGWAGHRPENTWTPLLFFLFGMNISKASAPNLTHRIIYSDITACGYFPAQWSWMKNECLISTCVPPPPASDVKNKTKKQQTLLFRQLHYPCRPFLWLPVPPPLSKRRECRLSALADTAATVKPANPSPNAWLQPESLCICKCARNWTLRHRINIPDQLSLQTLMHILIFCFPKWC